MFTRYHMEFRYAFTRCCYKRMTPNIEYKLKYILLWHYSGEDPEILYPYSVNISQYSMFFIMKCKLSKKVFFFSNAIELAPTCKYLCYIWNLWCRHQTEIFSALLALCEKSSPVTGESPSQRPMIRSFHVFFDLSLNQRLSKQPILRWFETPPRPLWRHCDTASAWYQISIIYGC